MISNVVMDAVVRTFLTVVTPTQAGTGGIGLTIIDLVDNFYANDGLVASTQPEKLHMAFDVLTSLFNRVGLRTNTENTVGVVFQSFHAPV